ncbi:hypothetical protein EV174_001033 [Coemansia sp. RSA 2320]|nr:hypothetical protein EV174_001033 [Coemansia sp. RSA 2320]
MFVDRNTLQTAYVSQTPWLMNSTIRESILFGLTYDPLWYAQVVDSCELLSDLDRMAAGDQTVVGTGGMALSGGQRVRVALARAVYSRPGLVFLDDFLVSVDTHVARRIIDPWWAADITLELGGQWWTNVVWQRSMFVKSHNELLASILAAPLSFFASTPLGHVLLLFTDSQRDVDTHMPQRLANVATFLVKLSFESWVILTFHPALVIAVVAVILAMRYIVTTSRHPLAAFLAAQTDSRPLIDEQYQEALDGAATIRAFGAHSFAERRLFARLTAFVSAQRAGDCTETWIDMSMSLLRGFVTTTAFGIALIGAATSNGLAVDPAYMSLVYWSITFHLARIQHLIRHSHALHASLDCATRYIKYTTIKPESHIDTARLELEIPDAWPSTGSIVFDRVCARYTRHYGNYGNEDDADKSLTTAAAAETQPLKHQNSSRSSGLALQDMSFSICSGQHVGIVGRTGAGKTSIAMALLGLLNPESGSIRIDSLDISMISPDKLRGRLSVVPQAPVVLPGSVRYNIDPKSEHSDDEVRKVLDAVGLSPDATLCLLDDNVPETWSTGQRQLLCIARAMLKHTNILILDEATAAVDSQASKRLHELIRRTFAQCTVITIAHRLETVYDCDQVLVVDDGRICESGTPASLLAQPGTHFARMAQQKK